MEKRYGILQLPAVLFIDANGKETPETRVTGLVTARDFAARMEKSLGSNTNPST
jgi:thiol:disulfide interchange protein